MYELLLTSRWTYVLSPKLHLPNMLRLSFLEHARMKRHVALVSDFPTCSDNQIQFSLATTFMKSLRKQVWVEERKGTKDWNLGTLTLRGLGVRKRWPVLGKSVRAVKAKASKGGNWKPSENNLSRKGTGSGVGNSLNYRLLMTRKTGRGSWLSITGAHLWSWYESFKCSDLGEEVGTARVIDNRVTFA